MQMYPNPNLGILHIDFDISYNSDVILRIYNVTGQLITKKIYAADKITVGKNHISLNLNKFEHRTVLFINLEAKNDRISQKLILSK